MNKEFRLLNDNINVDDNNKIIEGYAAIFNSYSEDLGGFVETIDKGAFDGVIVISDVFALLNHDDDRGILARSKKGNGTLSLSIDENGLKYSFQTPNTTLGNDVYEMIKRGDITASSFAFTVASDEWVKNSDGTYTRTIKKVEKLFDVSPVYTPAYSATSVDCKRFAEVLEAEKIENERVIKELEEKELEEKRLQEEKINNYYSDLQNRIDSIK